MIQPNLWTRLRNKFPNRHLHIQIGVSTLSIKCIYSLYV